MFYVCDRIIMYLKDQTETSVFLPSLLPTFHELQVKYQILWCHFLKHKVEIMLVSLFVPLGVHLIPFKYTIAFCCLLYTIDNCLIYIIFCSVSQKIVNIFGIKSVCAGFFFFALIFSPKRWCSTRYKKNIMKKYESYDFLRVLGLHRICRII